MSDSDTYRSIDEIGRVGLGGVGTRMQKGCSPDPLLPALPAAVRLMWDRRAMTGRMPQIWRAGCVRLD